MEPNVRHVPILAVQRMSKRLVCAAHTALQGSVVRLRDAPKLQCKLEDALLTEPRRRFVVLSSAPNKLFWVVCVKSTTMKLMGL
jgi:hypothetical protein